MTETESNILNVPDGTKKIKISIPQLEAKDAQIAELNKKIGEQEGIIKSMLRDDRKDFFPSESKPPTIGGDSSGHFLPPEPERHQVQKYHFDEESEVLSLNPKFPSTEEAINYIKKCAINPQSGDYKLANELYGKLANRALKQGGVFEFQGNMCRYERHGNEVVKSNRPKTFKRVDDL